MDHGIIDHYIKTVGASCLEFTHEDHFSLLATCACPRASRIDAEFDEHGVTKTSPVSGCSSVAGRFVLRVRYY